MTRARSRFTPETQSAQARDLLTRNENTSRIIAKSKAGAAER